MSTYLMIDAAGSVTGYTITDAPAQSGWIVADDLVPEPQIGWYTLDSGVTWAPPSLPTVATGAASGVTASGATITGTITPTCPDTSYLFEYGPTTAYGSQTAIETAGTGTTALDVSAALSGLTASTTYHYRLVGISAAGAAQGADSTFTTTV